MPDDPNEVVVIVPDAAANSPDGSSPSDEPVVVEVFDAVADPGGSDPGDSTGTTTGDPEVIVVEEGAAPDGGPEVIVIDPTAEAPGTDGDPSSDPTGGADPTGISDPITGAPDGGDAPTTGDPGTTDPGTTDPGTAEGVVDPTGNSPDT